jgi:peptide/nickel transport system permease protein
MREWMRRRSVRKFLANRLAVCAMVIIVVYILVAVSTGFFGLIAKEDTFERVGPKSVPGFFRQQEPEKRVADCEFVLNQFDRALSRKNNPQSAVNEIAYGYKSPADLPLSELRVIVDDAFAIYDALAESDDLNADASLLPQIEQLESKTEMLFAPLSGWTQFKQNIALCLGTDLQGRSIFLRAIYSIEVAISIGVVVAFISVLIGSLLGTAAGFFGGWVDYIVTWLFTTFSSIPSLVLLVLLAYMFTGSQIEGTLWPMYIAFSATYWIGPCRVIRGETLKLKELEYVQAATTLGYGRIYTMIWHILPNASHLMLINFSLLFIAAIKGEVILTYLGLGIKNGTSWGIMIEQSQPEVINGFFWQIGTATALMFGLVLAFNIMSDALQDAFDPKHVG